MTNATCHVIIGGFLSPNERPSFDITLNSEQRSTCARQEVICTTLSRASVWRPSVRGSGSISLHREGGRGRGGNAASGAQRRETRFT